MNNDVYSDSAIRRAAWQFLTGKVASALLTFTILLWLVRLLPVVEYGVYVVLIAGTELGFALAGLGLPWLAARYLPEYRLHAAGPVLIRLCRQLIIWQALALVTLTAIIALFMDDYLQCADLSTHSRVAWIALALLVTEGFGRFVCEGLMAPLMLQDKARFSLILRQSSFLSAIAAHSFAGDADLYWIMVAEVGASVIFSLAASHALVKHLHTLRGYIGETDWHEPKIAEQWRIALRMHLAHVITLVYGPQVFLIFIQRYLGAEASALFGFLRTINGQISRYLPATLLFTIIRPKLMATYLQGGMIELSRQVNLVGKLSLFVLLPLVVLVAIGGNTLVSLLSSGKFTNGGFYLLGLLLALVPFSQRQLLETVAVANGRAGLCTLASSIGLLTLPLMYLLLKIDLGLWAPVFANLFSQIIFNVTVVIGLKRCGYRMDLRGATKLAISAMLAGLIASGVHCMKPNVALLLLASSLAMLVFLAAGWWMQVFTQEERQLLDGVFGMRFFTR